MQKKFDLSIVIPVLCEKKNLKKLINKIEIYTKNLNKEIIFVDDDSKDGSYELVRNLKKKNLKFYIRKSKIKDLASSCIYGFNLANSNNILVMDGDLQHNPQYIKNMFGNFKRKKLDLLVATRDFKNSNFILYRKILSIILNFMINLILGGKVSDPLSGYFIFKKIVFTRNKKKLYGYGYKILMDLIYSPKKNFKIGQMSYVFSN